MSVVAVKIYADKIEIGADSQISSSWDKEMPEDRPVKIFKKDNIVFGCAGFLKEGQLMNLYLDTIEPKQLSSEIEYIRFFTTFEKWCKNELSDNNFKTGNQYIFVANGKVFSFCDYNVYEIKKYDAIGSGGQKALMGLELGFDVEKTLKAVCKFDLYCHEPIILYTI